jgi:outer membrane protein assembly factor BamB
MKSLVSVKVHAQADSPASQPASHSRIRRSRGLFARLLALSAAAALVVALMPAPALAAPVQPQIVAAGDWTQYHNGPTHQSYNAQENLLSSSDVAALGVAWTATTGANVSSSPAVADGVVYVGSLDGTLNAYAVGCASGAGTCTPIWTATISGAINSSPAVADGVIYVGSHDSKVYAFAVGCASGGGTCTPIWKATTGGLIDSSPAVADGVVYVASNDGKLYAYAVGCATGGGTCTPIWTATTGGYILASPAVADGVVYIGSSDHKLYAFAVGCATGGGICTPLWTATTGGAIWNSSPAVANGVVYVGSMDGKLDAYAVGCSSGGGTCTPLWTGVAGSTINSSPAVANGVVYIGSGSDWLSAFAVGCASGGGTCTPLWSAPTGNSIWNSSPAIANGVVYVGSSDGKLYAFAVGCASGGGTCTPLWTATTGSYIESSPAIANGVVYVGSDDHKLYAFAIAGATYHPMAPPVRMLDTRIGNGLSGKLLANTPATFQVAGRSPVPSNASAVTGNVTVVNSSSSWAVYLGPDPVANPTTSTINFATGEVTGNGLTVALSSTGSLSATYISNAGNTTDLVFDVTGYFTPDSSGATYHAISPARLLDTRIGTGLSGRLQANVPGTFPVAGVSGSGIPSNATAVTGNVTVVNPSFSWAVYLGPVATASPTTSTINFDTGQIKGNSLTVALGAGGSLSATYISAAGNTTDLVFDVTGYYTADSTGASFIPMTPARLLDTRFGNGLSSHLSANTPGTFQVSGRDSVPVYASAVTGNVTVVNETNSWAVFLGPNPTASPSTSTINFNTGDIKGNGLTVALGSGGSLSATYISTAGNTTDLVFDVTGYFVP